MKKLYIIIPIVLFFIIGIGLYSYVYVNKNREITPDEAVELCYFVLGKEDEKTGFPFSFGVTQTVEKDHKKYYAIRASWLVNNSHMSYIGDFFVSLDGREIYSG